MGLDVYLYRITDKEDSDRREAAYQEYSDSLWEGKKYDTASTEEKDDIRDKLRLFCSKNGLGEWGEDVINKQKIELDSDKHPDHMFKIGYMRSSYNGGGINRVLENMGLSDLYDIFGIEGDAGECQPNYDYALENVKEVLEELRADDGYRVVSITPNLFSGAKVTSEAMALEMFKKELEDKTNRASYSNLNGEFYMDKPLEVVALLPGISKIMGERPCTYAVYKNQNGNDWYIQALEVVQEMLEFILAHEKPHEFYMYWSG